MLDSADWAWAFWGVQVPQTMESWDLTLVVVDTAGGPRVGFGEYKPCFVDRLQSGAAVVDCYTDKVWADN